MSSLSSTLSPQLTSARALPARRAVAPVAPVAADAPGGGVPAVAAAGRVAAAGGAGDDGL